MPWREGRIFPVPARGVVNSHDDGWFIAPPIFSFSCQKKKRKRAVHGPKEKKKYVPARGRKTEARRACLRFLRMSSGRGVVRAGVWEVDAWPVRSSSLPLIRR